MSVKKPVIVRIDGKETKMSSIKKRNYRGEKIEHIGREEVAASEETGANKIHTFAREYDSSLMISNKKTKQQSNLAMFKPIIIAIISAITVGSIMGFIMLKIIVNFDNDLNASPAFLVPGEEENEDSDKQGNAASPNTVATTLEPMTAFVLQGGVFSSTQNAEAESKKFLNQGYSPVIWEKDGQFYLLVNLGLSKGDLQDDTNQLKQNGIEVYAKEWLVSKQEVALSKEEHDWIVSFQDQWNMSLGEGTIDVGTWQDLLANVPEHSEKLTSFSANIGEQINALNEKDTEGFLLSVWETYDSLTLN